MLLGSEHLNYGFTHKYALKSFFYERCSYFFLFHVALALYLPHPKVKAGGILYKYFSLHASLFNQHTLL
jgi:hypothetical protein